MLGLARTMPAPAPIAGAEMQALVRIGFHGVFNGRADEALRLFESLTPLRPEAAFPYVGRALALLAMRRTTEAVSLLETEARRRCPGDETVDLYLGLALRLDHRLAQAQTVLKPIAAAGADQALANALLDLKF